MLCPFPVIVLLKMSGLRKRIHQTGDNDNSGEREGSGWEEKWGNRISTLFTSELLE